MFFWYTFDGTWEMERFEILLRFAYCGSIVIDFNLIIDIPYIPADRQTERQTDSFDFVLQYVGEP